MFRKPITLLSGTSNPLLARNIADQLKKPLSPVLVTQFSDGETRIEINISLRNQFVYVIQSLSTPVNHHVMELCLMIDAIKRAAPKRITLVIPYFGYARQDKRLDSNIVPISAKVIARLLETVGMDEIITVDLHSESLHGFFEKPITNLFTTDLFLNDLSHKNLENPLIVSPDVGGVLRARRFAEKLGISDFAIIDKKRLKPNEADVMHLIGDVKDRHCVIIDDLIDTAHTVCNAATVLKEKGAHSVIAYVTHPVLSNNALQTLEQSPLDELVVTDSILLSDKIKACPFIRVLSLASLFENTIKHLSLNI